MDAELEIRRRTLSDVWDIGDKTMKALEVLEAWCPSKNKLQATLAVAGAVASVAIAVVNPGALTTALGGAKIGGELLKGAATTLAASNVLTAKVEIGGMTAMDVISSMGNAMTRLRTEIDNQEREVANCLRTFLGAVQDAMSEVLILPPERLLNLATADVDGLKADRGFHDR